MSGGECQTKNVNSYDEDKDDKPIKALDEGKLLYTPYTPHVYKHRDLIISPSFFLSLLR